MNVITKKDIFHVIIILIIFLLIIFDGSIYTVLIYYLGVVIGSFHGYYRMKEEELKNTKTKMKGGK